MPRVLSRLTIESISPVSLGGYDKKISRSIGKVQIEEPFRLSSLKGAWRWWMRTYLAGAAYDKERDEREAVKMADKLLGSTEIASKFGLKFSKLVPFEGVNDHDFKYAKDIPRVKLLLMRKRCREQKEEYIKAFSKGFLAEIELYERVKAHKTESRLALGSLITALKLGGLGKISRRGFGSFKLKLVLYDDNLEYLGKSAEKIEREETLEDGLKELISFTYDASCEAVDIPFKTKHILLPSIPAICLKRREAFSIYLLNPPKALIKNIYEILKDVGNATFRMKSWSVACRLIGTGGNYRSALTLPIAFILGLPRTQEARGHVCPRCKAKLRTLHRIKKGQRLQCPECSYIFMNWWELREWREPTGYIVEGRRASPLIFSFLTKNTLGACFMMSLDWPSKIKWRSIQGKRRKKSIGSIRIKEETIKIMNESISINTTQKTLLNIANDLRVAFQDYFRGINWNVKEVDFSCSH